MMILLQLVIIMIIFVMIVHTGNVYDYNYHDDDDRYVDMMCSDDDDKLALVRGVSHIWCAPGGQMNIAGHI